MTTDSPKNTQERVNSATEVLGNALRLYLDAKLLFEHERYPSCVSLSILAMEELAKFMALAGYQPLPSSGWRSHLNKQLSPASFLLRKRYQATLKEITSEQKLGEADDTYKRWADMDFAPDEMSFFDTVLARIVAEGSLNRFTDAHGKETDRLKQLGFYVDLDDKKRVRNTPAVITRETAQDRLDFARDVLGALRAQM
jgi:AbiV family abortive infection protein